MNRTVSPLRVIPATNRTVQFVPWPMVNEGSKSQP